MIFSSKKKVAEGRFELPLLKQDIACYLYTIRAIVNIKPATGIEPILIYNESPTIRLLCN